MLTNLVGRIIPISPGRMRNDFYPKEKAEYMTMAQLRASGVQESAMERDSTFGSRQDRIAARKSEGIDSTIVDPHAVPKAVEVDLIKVRRIRHSLFNTGVPLTIYPA